MIDYKRNKRVLIYDTTAVSTDKYNAGANDSANTCSRRFHYYRARSALRFCPPWRENTHVHTYVRTYVLSYIGGDKIIFYHAARFPLSLFLPRANVASMRTRCIMYLTAVQTFIRFSKIRSIRRDWIWPSGYGFCGRNCDGSKYQLARLFFLTCRNIRHQ